MLDVDAVNIPDVSWWDLACRLWMAGYRDSDIGRQIGVSRQRIGQVKSYFPARPWIELGEIEQFNGPSELTFRRWIAKGWVRRSPSGLYHQEDIATTRRRLLARPCQYPGCSQPIGIIDILARWCAEHSLEVRRYRYPVMNEREKRAHYSRTRRWVANHPETAQEMQRRASQAFKKRQRYKRQN